MLTVADLRRALDGVSQDLPVQVHVELDLEPYDAVMGEIDEWAAAFRAEPGSVPGEGPAFVISM